MPEDKKTDEVAAKPASKKDESGFDTADVPKGKLRIKVYAPFKVYFDGIADSISAENDTGPFDILAGHKNFMTLLNPCELIIRSEQEEKIKISRGILHVKGGRITVFLDV
jgi:F0F1-type ATP synthase epsilon subunit